MPNLLIVDDEPNVLYSFRKGLESGSLRVTTAETAAEGIRLVEEQKPDAMVLDVRLPDMSGLEAFDRIRRIDPRLPVIVVTAHSTTDTAIDAMKRGAYEYLLKPVDIHHLQELVEKAVALGRLPHVTAAHGGGDDAPGDRIVGRSPAMQEVYKTIGRVAPEDVAVLLLGESGTGKELAARAVYQHSRRSARPFLAINCAALPEPLLESELFGHERGAFTGADRQRIGKFEQAHGGTVFLDELGDMSAATQAKILRVLQDGRFERVGGNETIQTDVRVVAATNQDLESRIRMGAFRRDLLYRLNGFTIRLPPLRERLEDLPLLCEHFLKRARQELTRPAMTLAPETLRLLAACPWPGNVRELESVIRYAVVHAAGDVVTPECLPPHCRGAGRPAASPTEDEIAGLRRFVRRLLNEGESDLYRRLVGELERVALEEALEHVRGNQVHASQRLGLSRTTLRAKLSRLRLEEM